jgi:hypothetical protein
LRAFQGTGAPNISHGIGAPKTSRRLTLAALAALCTMTGGLLFSGAVAQAELSHFYTGHSFGPGGLGVGTFSAEQPLGVAVEQSSGDVYVYDGGAAGGSIYKFNASGEPVDFSALGANVITGVGSDIGSLYTQIAVSSAGPTVGDIYVANYGSDVHIYGPEGSLIGELKPQSGGPEFCGVAVDSAGHVYTASNLGRVDEYTPVTAPVTNSDYTSSLWGLGETCDIAVDSEGDVYTNTPEGPVRKYEASQFNTLEVPAIGTQITEGGRNTLAVDPAPAHDELYIDATNSIAQYDSSGKRLGTTGAAGPGALSGSYGIAVDHASGEVYADDGGSGVVEIFGPATVLAEVSTGAASDVPPTSATLEGTVNPGNVPVSACEFEYGTETTYGKSISCSQTVPFSGEASVPVTADLPGLLANTAYHYRLVARNANGPSYGADGTFTTQGPPTITFESAEPTGHYSATLQAQINPGGLETTYHFEYGTSTSYGTSIPIPDGTLPAGFFAEGVSAELTGLAVGTTYHYRVVAVNADSPTPVYGPDQTFTTVPAALIEYESVSDVAGTSATLNAYINPLGNDTHYYFQYGTTSCATSPSSCTDAPSPPGTDIGSEEASKQVSNHLQGLALDTTYHYRTVASNALGTAYGAELTFKTQPAGGELVLPDGRAWELVSPPTKDGAKIEPPSLESGDIQASAEGGAITYLAKAPIGEAASNIAPVFEQIFSTRGSGGWSSQSISPPTASPTGTSIGFGSEYRLFSSDLSLGLAEPALLQDEASLAPEALEGTLYLREDFNGGYVPLVTAANTPADTKLNEYNPGEARNERARFAGASPDLSHVVFGAAAALTSNAVKNGRIPSLYEWTAGQLQLVSVLPNRKPASAEGHYAFLGSDGTDESNFSFLKIGKVRHAVSEDGSRIVWNTGEEEEGGHLYMRDMARGETVQLDAAAQGVSEPVGSGEAVFQIANSEGSRVFFSDGQKLTADSTADGRNGLNLYVFEVTSGSGEPLAGKLTDLTVTAGAGSRVYGASEDGSYVYAQDFVHYTGAEWTGTPIPASIGGSESSRRVSPNGLYFAFESGNGQVELYDANTGRVVCVSCSPTGEAGGGSLPEWTQNGFNSAVYQSRYLSDNGRLFFKSAAALVPQDTSGGVEVYEYEPAGVGSCESSSSTFSEASGGCVGLISSGTSSGGSTFLDASENGDNVFFLTGQRLVSQDYDKAVDVYDAHVCSAAAPCLTAPVAPPACTTADSCRAAPSTQPAIFGASGSAMFSGAGNIAPAVVKPVAKAKAKPCKKGYMKKKGKCVKKKSKKKAKKAKKASRERRGK